MRLNLQGRDEIIDVIALSFPRICSPLPRHVELNPCSNLQELDLADRPPLDEAFNCSDSSVDVLIGSDYYWDVVDGEIIRGAGGLVAVRSKFGWLLSGPVQSKDCKNITHSNVVIDSPFDSQQEADSEVELGNELRKFWDFESLGIMEINKETREELFPASIKYNWNASDAHFLPHHGVVREDKDTTKLRIVFDRSAKVEISHHSLNGCLEKSPNLTSLVFDVLLKFWMRCIGITADIEKAFHQIMINTND